MIERGTSQSKNSVANFVRAAKCFQPRKTQHVSDTAGQQCRGKKNTGAGNEASNASESQSNNRNWI